MTCLATLLPHWIRDWKNTACSKIRMQKLKFTHKIDWSHRCENIAGAGTKIQKRSFHTCRSVQIRKPDVGFLAQPDANSQKLARHDRNLRSCLASTQQTWIRGFTKPSAGTICDCPTTSNFCRKQAPEILEGKVTNTHTVSAIKAALALKTIVYPLMLLP